MEWEVLSLPSWMKTETVAGLTTWGPHLKPQLMMSLINLPNKNSFFLFLLSDLSPTSELIMDPTLSTIHTWWCPSGFFWHLSSKFPYIFPSLTRTKNFTSCYIRYKDLVSIQYHSIVSETEKERICLAAKLNLTSLFRLSKE